MKTCSKCNKEKQLSDFYKSSRYTDGYDYKCKTCEKKRSLKKYTKTYNDYEWRLKQLIKFSKHRARKKNIEHTLTLEDLKDLYPSNNKCPVFNIELEWGGNKDNSPSVDKIDSAKGYTKDNCQIISFRANFLKSNATIEELETVINFLKNSQRITE